MLSSIQINAITIQCYAIHFMLYFVSFITIESILPFFPPPFDTNSKHMLNHYCYIDGQAKVSSALQQSIYGENTSNLTMERIYSEAEGREQARVIADTVFNLMCALLNTLTLVHFNLQFGI